MKTWAIIQKRCFALRGYEKFEMSNICYRLVATDIFCVVIVVYNF